MLNIFRPLFYRFWQNIAAIFRPRNLVWHALAVILTFIILMTGFDWWWFVHTQRFWALAFPAVFMGMFLPILVPVILYIIGRLRNEIETVLVASLLGQAALLATLVSGAYKAFTGRIPPAFTHGVVNVAAAAATDYSHGFRFGFLRGGVFWGWPSTHTAVAFAMAVALVTLFPKNKIVRWLALIYAFYIGLAVSVSIHWLSEFVAGAIFGIITALAVGRAYRARLAGSSIPPG